MFPYSTIFQPVFWMLMGILTLLFFIGMRYWLQDINIKMNWWKWIVVFLWLFLLAVTLGAGFTLMGEGEWDAGKRFLLYFGIVLVVSGIIVWVLLKYIAKEEVKKKN